MPIQRARRRGLGAPRAPGHHRVIHVPQAPGKIGVQHFSVSLGFFNSSGNREFYRHSASGRLSASPDLSRNRCRVVEESDHLDDNRDYLPKSPPRLVPLEASFKPVPSFPAIITCRRRRTGQGRGQTGEGKSHLVKHEEGEEGGRAPPISDPKSDLTDTVPSAIQAATPPPSLPPTSHLREE